jgi:hypothetical protein
MRLEIGGRDTPQFDKLDHDLFGKAEDFFVIGIHNGLAPVDSSKSAAVEAKKKASAGWREGRKR